MKRENVIKALSKVETATSAAIQVSGGISVCSIMRGKINLAKRSALVCTGAAVADIVVKSVLGVMAITDYMNETDEIVEEMEDVYNNSEEEKLQDIAEECGEESFEPEEVDEPEEETEEDTINS